MVILMITYGVVGIKQIKDKVFDNKDYIKKVFSELSDIKQVISGGSQGVETVVETYCIESGISFKKITPDFQAIKSLQFIDGVRDKEGVQRVYSQRNKSIAEEADVVIVFWNGYTNKSVFQLISEATLLKKRVIIFPV
jgi:hypothetical protein